MRVMILFLLALFNANLAFSAIPSVTAELTLCYEAESQPPYFIASSETDSALIGTLPAKIKTAALAENLQVSFINKPWNRCISMMQRGEVDGVFPIIWTRNRDSWGQFPKSNTAIDSSARLHHAIYKIFTHHHSQMSWDGRQFHGLREGLSSPMGYIVSEQLKLYRASNQFRHAPEIGFQLLSKGRLDGYIVEEQVGGYFLSESRHSNIRAIPTSFFEADWHLAFSNQWVARNPHLAQRIWENLRRENKNE